ncbi:MAG: glycosyltransferase family 2 protein [Gammaproteobacteria bacterium]
MDDVVPEVSVVIPTHNRAVELIRAMHSAVAQVGVEHLEVIVVDDCSSDGTRPAVQAFADSRVRYFRFETNRGGCAARNLGIERARAPVIAFLDDDDEWLSNKLERQLPLLETYDAALCGFYVGRSGRADIVHTNEVRLSHLRKRSPAPTSALIGKTGVLRQLRFDESLSNGQEWDLYMRLLEGHRIGYVSAPLFFLDVDREDSITAAAKAVTVADIGKRMMAVNKHRARLGPYWHRYRYAAHLLMYFRHRNDRMVRLKEAWRKSGLLASAHVLCDRALRRLTSKLSLGRRVVRKEV